MTPRRLAAARRALQKEREKVPLFADQLVTDSPEERISKKDGAVIDGIRKRRELQARLWRQVRGKYYALSASERAVVKAYWDSSQMPGCPAYLSYVLREYS